MNTIRILPALLLAAFGTAAVAKLPAPDEATKAKAAETAAKAAWQGKVDGWLLCKSQDKVAAKYGASKATAAKTAAATPAKPGGPSPVATAPAGTQVVASSAPPPCADPGPFAYTPPAQKPLEAAGAHSPAGNATSPPNMRAPSAAMDAAKPSAAPAAPAAPAKKS